MCAQSGGHGCSITSQRSTGTPLRGKDTDVLAVNIVQVIYLALRLVTDVRFISIKSRCESQLP